MKVDYTRPAYGTSGTYGSDLTTPRTSTQVASSPSGADTLSISGDVALAKRALIAAQATSDTRPDAVARGKALVESGNAGVDLEELSDALISRLLESWRME